MTYIEIPLWLTIVVIVILFVVLHLMFGDLVANILCRYLKDKENKDKQKEGD